MKKIYMVAVIIATSGLAYAENPELASMESRQRSYDAQHPVFEPDGPDFNVVDDNKSWDILPDGLHGSIGSVDCLYAKRSLPKLQSKTNHWSGVAWQGERVHAQIILYSKEDVQQLRFDTTPLTSDSGATLPHESLHPRFVRYVLAENKLCPDILDPIKSLDMPARTTRSVWVMINVPANTEPGRYIGNIGILAAGQKRLDFVFELEVLPLALPAIIVAVAVPASGQTIVTPAPRDITWTDQRLDLVETVIRAEGPREQQVARLLAHEMQRLHDVKLTVTSGSSSKPGPSITLALSGSPEGKAVFENMAGKAKWPPPRNVTEGYLLEVGSNNAVVFAESQRGLVYGCQTLLQLVAPAPEGKARQLLGARIADYPQLSFRGVHICIFPNTELAAVRQMILLAARFKYNAVVIEPWASLKSKKRPETAYENAYSHEQIRPLVRLGHALGMEMIPMLNSWGHASGMRSRAGEHVVLDRYPQHKNIYEPDGWSFCLSNPDIYDHLFDRYGELLELFAPARYFHVGMDEAWGHLGLTESRECRGDEPLELIDQHLHKLHAYFARRNVQVFMWHDMFLQKNHPQLGRQKPANSVPPFNTHLALPKLPKDTIIAAWNYKQYSEWPVPKYFHDKGFPVVVCPWKSKRNTIAMVNTAKKHNLRGLLATTWDSLDVCQPSVARAGVLAWTAPGDDLEAVPFEHWLDAIRVLPICNLPKLEKTLVTGEDSSRSGGVGPGNPR